MTVADYILSLSALDGPAGFEGRAGKAVGDMLRPLVDEVWTDALGNIVGLKRCGRDGARRLLVDAHIDEVGLIVTGAEEGFLRFSALGSLDARLLPAAEVKILTDPPIAGVIGALPPHILRADESDSPLKLEEMYIDAGLKAEEAEKAVPPGTAAVFSSGARLFGDGLVCGKALDNRAGLACVMYALEMLKGVRLGVDLYVLASVQEEVGTRGAKAGAFAIAPDWCIAVDADHARTYDSPRHGLRELGAGAVITRGPNMNRALTESAVRIAEERGIPFQIGVEPGDSGTNLRAIQVSRAGVATALFGLPVRYMHSPAEVASISDAEAVSKLVCEVAKSLEGGAGCA